MRKWKLRLARVGGQSAPQDKLIETRFPSRHDSGARRVALRNASRIPVFGTLIGLLSACGGQDRAVAPAAPAPTAPSAEISDAVHNNGNARFFFLPPMVAAPSPGGTFDAALSPVVAVCEWDGSCGAVVAQFATGTGSSSLRVDVSEEHYIVNWNTKECLSGPCSLDPAKTYRLRVTVGAVELGFADLDVVSNGSQLRNVQTGEQIGLVDGRTLPVKFRIEQGIVGLVRVTPNPGEVEVGQSTQLALAVSDLHANAITGRAVTWISHDQGIAIVDATGLASGVAVGCTTVQAVVDGVSGSAELCVTSPPVVDVATTALSNTFLPGVAAPVMAQWGDGTLLVASAYPNTASYNVNASGPGQVTWAPFALSGSRPSIWIPRNEPFPEIAIAGYDRLRAQSRNNVTLWENGDFGCCSQVLGGFALEPNVGVHWRIKGQVRLDLRTGTSSGGTYLVDLADTYITPDFIWEVPGGANFVRRRAWLSEQGVQMPLPAVHTIIPISQVQLHGALTAAMGYVHPTTENGGYLTHFTPNGLAWSKVVPGVGAPVITGQDLVVAGSSEQAGHSVLALSLADGSEAWKVSVPAKVQDLVVGEGGNLFVLLPNSMLVLDAMTGALRQTYINFAFAVEMLLSNGTMYILTQPPGQGAGLIAVAVVSSQYETLSPWPVRFGDNQRTSHLSAGRVR